MIPRKTFLLLLDLDAQHLADPTPETGKAVEDAMDAAGWPWKASREQVTYWNEIQAQRNR